MTKNMSLTNWVLTEMYKNGVYQEIAKRISYIGKGSGYHI